MRSLPLYQYSTFLPLLIYLFVFLTMGSTGAPEKDTLYCTRVSLRISLIKNKIEVCGMDFSLPFIFVGYTSVTGLYFSTLLIF